MVRVAGMRAFLRRDTAADSRSTMMVCCDGRSSIIADLERGSNAASRVMTTIYYAISKGFEGQKTDGGLFPKSPGRIRLSVGAGFGGAGMDVVDAGLGLIERVHGLGGVGDPGVFAARHGIFGDGSDVAILHQVVER